MRGAGLPPEALITDAGDAAWENPSLPMCLGMKLRVPGLWLILTLDWGQMGGENQGK